MRLVSQVVLFIMLFPFLFQASFAQNIQITPIDTAGDVGSGAKLKLDRDGNPHIFYYDYTNNREKYAYLQDGNWHVENSFQRNDLGDFEIDSLGNIHCSFARYQILEYGFIANDTLQISRIDSTFEWYFDPEIELLDGIPHVVSIQSFSEQLIEAYPRNNNWIMDTVCSLPSNAGFLEFKNYLDSKHAVYAGLDDESLIHSVWSSGMPTSEYIRQDSVYGYTSMDLDRDGNPWVAYEGNNYFNGHPIFIAHKTGSEWQTEMLDTTYHGRIPYMRYSPLENTFYVLFIVYQSENRKLMLCHKVGNNWEYEDLYDGPVYSGQMEIDANGNIHIAFCLNTPGDYDLYYGLIYSPIGIDETRNNKPEKVSLSCYPNPFNSSISISYSNLNGGEIGIYNIVGQKIRTFQIEAMRGQVIWNGTDDNNNPVSSGVYFAKMKTSSADATFKLILLK